MKNRSIKLILVILSLILAIRVATVFVADRLYIMSMAEKKGRISAERALLLLKWAGRLDFTNADIYFRKYQVLDFLTPGKYSRKEYSIYKRKLHLLRSCIDLCPSKAEYHIYYALTLKAMHPNPNIQARQLILSELRKSVELKPYSETYRKIYKSYLKKYSL